MSTTTDFQTGQTSAEEKDFLLWMSDSRRVKPIQIKTLDNYDGWVLSAIVAVGCQMNPSESFR